MNRRKPRLDVAVVPMAPGETRDAAVLRKAVAAAALSVAEQSAADQRFAAGYLAGYARQQALKHGVDGEADGGAALLAAVAAGAPPALQAAVAGLQLMPRPVPAPRAKLGCCEPVADAGYLVGHLAALCGARGLLFGGGDVQAYLTRCDQAADRMQTHHPTAVLRLDPAERAAVMAALTTT